jgi:hypothetical protein
LAAQRLPLCTIYGRWTNNFSEAMLMNLYLLQALSFSIGIFCSLHRPPCAPPPPTSSCISSDSLNVDRLVLLMDCLTRTISFLNLPPNLRILVSIDLRPCQLSCQLIPANNDGRIRLKEAIDVFESSIGGLGVEEVGNRNEGEADAGLIMEVRSARD